MPVTLTSEDFGSHKGEVIKKFTWTTDSGFSVSAISYGAIIQAIRVPDKNGVVQDVALGFDDLPGYETKNKEYFGAPLGRCANRVAGGTFEIDGQKYTLAKNQGNHSLHGGLVGYNKRTWQTVIEATKVTFSILSPHNEEGYPGDVIVSISYDVTEDTLLTEYTATSNRRTLVNLTNHSYFNLAGHDAGAEALFDHVVSINADKITETDAEQIPTGRFIDVGGTPYDFRVPTKLGDAMQTGGFDNNYCVTKHGQKGVTLVSRVVHPPSGRYLEVHSDQPGVQFYTSNNLSAPSQAALEGKGGVGYRMYGAFCLETQNYPDAVHHVNFPSPILNPGQVYKHICNFKFGAEKVEQGTFQPQVIAAK